MQIYEGKSAEFVNFATKLACFDWNGGVDNQKGREKSAATAVYHLIENKNINNTIIAVLIFYVTKKIIKKNNIK